jgi:glucose/arabinose dehydrogenase/PKD repeat protein
MGVTALPRLRAQDEKRTDLLARRVQVLQCRRVSWPLRTLRCALPTKRGLAAGLLLALAFSLAALSSPAQAAPTQPDFTEDVVFSGLVSPTDVAFAADGRVFVAEKSGLIKLFDNLNDTTATTVGDLRTNVHNFWDRGLLGMVLDPQFPVRPYVYVLYTHDAAIGGTAPRWGTPGATSDSCPTPPGATADGCVVSGRLSRLELTGSTLGSEQVLIEDWCQQYPSHSIGALAFGGDGALYVTGGDGASFNFADYGQSGSPRNPCGDPPVPVGGVQSPPSAQGGALRSQDLGTTLDPTGLNGSVLRVDPNTGAGLPDNPLALSQDANARRIVATGLRNPFRMTMRPGTSEVWVGDVGWSAWEEINRIGNPIDGSVDNFGWPCYEGDGRQGGYDGANLTICEDLYGQPTATRQPHFTYSHGASVIAGDNCATGGSSTAGLAFYPGGDYPAAYDGALFFADFSRRCVWVMFQQNGTPTPSTRQLFARDIGLVNLKAGPGGDIFAVDFSAGAIRRFRYQSTNHLPTASAQATPTNGPVPLAVSFDGRGSSDPDPGDTLSYAWDLDGDGAFDDASTPQAQWTYQAPGQVTVRLRVTDPSGESDTDSVVITPSEGAPQASIEAPVPTVTWAVDQTINFRGSATDPQDGALPASRLSWRLLLQHCTTVDNCHTHPLESWEGVSEGSFVAPDHGYPSHLELELTATDSAGLTDTQTVRLDPRTVDLTFRTEPSGLRLSVGAGEEVTPFTRRVIVGSRNSISAPTPQALGPAQYRFASWSDGGAGAHEIVAPSSPTTFTATYEADPTPTPTGLVAAFGFNEGTGSEAADSSPEGNMGTLSGAAWAAAGRFGGALSFDGLNDWVTVADDPSLDMTTALTMEAWVRPSAVASGHRTVVMKERPGGHAWTLYSTYAAPRAEVYVAGYRGASGTAPLPAGTWAHLAGTVSGGSVRLYVNGTLVKTTALPGPLTSTDSPLRIGGNSYWTKEYFAGLIDEVRVYNRALSAAEIQADMNTAVAP